MQLKNLILSITICGLVGCQQAAKEVSEKPLIVTTTGMLADATKNIVGNTAVVKSLMGPGVDPHLYKATQGDLELLTKANMIIYNGLYLESKMGEVLKKLEHNRPVVAAAEVISKDKRLQSLQYTDTYDPHVWHNVSLWKSVVQQINDKIQKYYPNNKNIYNKNKTNYINKLDSLHNSVLHEVTTIPPRQRYLITAHDAFMYFGSAYGIEVRGLQGISTLTELGLKDVTELVEFIVNHQIKSIFVETSVSEKAIRAVVEGCKGRGWDVTIGGKLYSDALGAEGTPEGTYIGMINSNVQTIVNALR